MTARPTPESVSQNQHLDGLAQGNILVVHAHPDDESMANSELFAALTEHDPKRVYCLTATAGEASTKGAAAAASGQRADELQRAQAYLGILPENCRQLWLPDSQLHRRHNTLRLAAQVMKLCMKEKISTLITPGEFDGHSDHIAADTASKLAAGALRLVRRPVDVWSLDTSGSGELRLPVNSDRKRAALMHHTSQSADFDEVVTRAPYSGLMQVETYRKHDVTLRQTLGLLWRSRRQNIPH